MQTKMDIHFDGTGWFVAHSSATTKNMGRPAYVTVMLEQQGADELLLSFENYKHIDLLVTGLQEASARLRDLR